MFDETAFIVNSLALLYHCVLVFFMAAGFTMLEAGLVRTKSVTTILLKNVTLISIASLGYFLIGFNLMFVDANESLIGSIGIWKANTKGVSEIFDYSMVASEAVILFQCLFAVTTASIVSGAVAERIRLLPFFAFVVFLSAFIYPIQGSWSWGGGWLSSLGFVDIAGGTHVHSVAGCAALVGIIVLGPRRGRFSESSSVRLMPNSSLPLATLGTMILWLGWLGFNGGSIGNIGSTDAVLSVSRSYLNTFLSSCGGVLATVLVLQASRKRLDLSIVLNGALAGLVSITANPAAPEPLMAAAIGAVGAILMIVTTKLLLRLRIDDVVGAVPVHLSCGIWGTLVASQTQANASLEVQLIGVCAICAFTFVSSFFAWFLLSKSMRLRLSQGEEAIGIDRVETGALAYPEFVTKSPS